MIPAILTLEDGRVFNGISIGALGSAVGEVIFNTSMTGYQEILSDPSYCEQIVTLTYPHIGNTGINTIDNEADKVFARGLVIRDLAITHSNWRHSSRLEQYLLDNDIIAISNIDTRSLTRHLRRYGALKGCITTEFDAATATQEAKTYQGIENTDLAQVVSTQKSYDFNQGSYNLLTQNFKETVPKYKVIVYDFGAKKNILRMLVDRGCSLTVVPAKTLAIEVLKMQPDGVFLSNGPGDPEPCDYALANIKTLLDNNMPIFGICLGHQLLGLANNSTTIKMKFGHHGANHPVQDLNTKEVFITSQNHGFALNDNDNDHLEITHRSLFDNSIQGIKVKHKKAFGFQGHPEASPGPMDCTYLFDNFIRSMQ